MSEQNTPSYDELLVQMRDIARVVTAMANGDLSQKVTVDATGEMFELKTTVNTMADQLHSFAAEAMRLSNDLGMEGRFGGQMEVEGLGGTWKELSDSMNGMASNLTDQVRDLAGTITAIAMGDLACKMRVGAEGEILELKQTINVMVEQFNLFACEVIRVSREIGTAGNFGGQMKVKAITGTWSDVAENVNHMSNSLSIQVRSLSDTVKAVLDGDTTHSITVEAQGEMKELRDALNLLIKQAANES